ncbi:excalibur calcium-binding domain-containing protein [Heyndrickxia oleronia]|uniref:excalibur calcium-binding domain-containing protein n=1 Tax=Heyndrickxia oleronia TaxID=38875 RepID=UPI003F24DD24
MKKLVSLALACILIFAFGLSDISKAKTQIISYKNCTELNKVYRGGVAQSASVKNKGGKTRYTPFVSKELYNKNTRLDRDKDLIACER